ncbi:MAG: 3-isopropylmalate dehydratase small subunit [Pseudomonadales bacterium]|jgi:3-isopropylmalate/(R)-2-methylmalate dehydratase small subunit|tara:strand:+ start:159 stop:791 length:633 start_codon:yes stop_codon:yes gene_type:complete
MDAFTQLEAMTAPLDRANVDTDQIIPKQYLKSIKRIGFGDYLFDAWRFLDQGTMGMTPNERQINHEFVLNLPQYQGAGILLTRDNFGCGSSREHAVWALKEFGFRAVIAPSFADIFFGNCFKNGVLPIVLEAKIVEELIAKSNGDFTLRIDLESQTVTDGERVYDFEIDSALKQKMLNGMDDIAMTLEEVELIETFEAKHKTSQPWLFRG